MQNFFYQKCFQTGKILRKKETTHWNQLLEQLEQLHQGFKKLKTQKIQTKINNLELLQKLVKDNEQYFVTSISDDMGKIKQEAQLEYNKTMGHFDYYIKNGEKFLAMKTWHENQNQFCQFPEPIGVIYKITPFNFPLWIGMKAVIPNILLGNTMAVKITENCLNTAELMDNVFNQFNPEYAQVLYPSKEESMKIIKCGYVQGVSFTGGENGGQQVAQTAAQYLKKTVLELGGSDPCIIGKTKNNKTTIENFLKGRLMNMGQVCSSPKRVFVLDSLKNEFIQIVKQYLQNQPEPTYLINEDAFQKVYDQVEEAIQSGDKLLYGQLQKCKSQKKIYPLFIQCKKDSVLMTEEVFGPVIAVQFINSLEQGIQLANETRYGLGASIFYHDYKKAEQLAKKIQSGQVSINGICTSNSGLPWGGIKKSGYGIESGQFGMEYFANIKTVVRPRDSYHNIYKQNYLLSIKLYSMIQ